MADDVPEMYNWFEVAVYSGPGAVHALVLGPAFAELELLGVTGYGGAGASVLVRTRLLDARSAVHPVAAASGS